MAAERFIISMKYGTAYPALYVNVLFNAVRATMRSNHRFICLTDDASGLLPGIEAWPIPDLGLAPHEWFVGGVWPKVSLFDGAFHGLRGRAVFIDLDMVILRDLDAFFDQDGDVIGLNAGAGWGRGGLPTAFGTGIFAFDLGSHPEIADRFRHEKQVIMKSFRTEQAYAASILPNITYWPEDWVLSFKRSLRQPIGFDLFIPPRKPPSSAKVIAFHGTPRPRDLLGQGPRFWDRFPHLGHGPVPWVVDYWNQHSKS